MFGGGEGKVINEDFSKNLVIFFVEENFIFIGASVEDVIKVLRFKISVVVFTGHNLSIDDSRVNVKVRNLSIGRWEYF